MESKIDNFITSDDILGLNVIDVNGKVIGVAEKILVDEKSLQITGIVTDKGILRHGLTIGTAYINRITPHAIFLNTSIFYDVKGRTVFDSYGAKVGKVKKVNLDESFNSIRSIEVKSGLTKRLTVPKNMIETIGDSIVLKVPRKELGNVKNHLPKQG